MGTEEEALSAQCAACHSYLSVPAVRTCGWEDVVQSGLVKVLARKEEGDGLDSDWGLVKRQWGEW